MNKTKIKEIALQYGFKLKEQADGSMDLNEYVYRFAQKMYADGAWAMKCKMEKMKGKE